MNYKIVFSTLVAAISLGARTHAENLTTIDGKIYYNISKQRVDADGLYIEYTPVSGGMGVAKVKFSRLSRQLQNQYGYDEAKAKEFEAEHAAGVQAWIAETERQQKESRDRHYNDEVQSAQDLAIRNQEIMAAEQQGQTVQYAGGAVGDGWDGGYLVAVPRVPQPLQGAPANDHKNPTPKPFVGGTSLASGFHHR